MADESAVKAQDDSISREASAVRQPSAPAALSLATLGTGLPVSAPSLLFNRDQPEQGLERQDEREKIDYDAVYADVFVIRDEVRNQVAECHEKLQLPATDITENADWKQVEASVKDACDDIQKLTSGIEAETGVAGNLRRAFRFLCKHAGAGETFVSVIPTDQFGFASVLCGGLKAVFSALKHTHEYREKVYRALEDLPYMIGDHSAPLDDHINDEELHRRAAALHIAVFKVIKRILRWWLSRPLVTAIKRVVNPTKLLSALQEDLAEVKVNAERFRRRANIITQTLIRQSLRLQYSSSLEIQALRNDFKILQERICRADRLDKLGAPPKRVTDSSADHSPDVIPKSRKRRQNTPETKIDSVLDELCYERDLVPDDCQALMRLMSPQRSSVADCDRILAIESSFRVRAWLVIDESSLLLVDGRAESRRDIQVSVFVARIVHRLLPWQEEATEETDESSPVIIPLAFFCSRHRDQQHDAHSNPTELAMSLLLQLIDLHRFNFRPSLLQKVQAKLNPRDMSSICYALGELITNLEDNSVLILIVEGLVHFAQDGEQAEQTRELVSYLVAIYRRRPAATLKILFSSPTRPEFVEDLFLEKEVLCLPRSTTPVRSPNNMHWKKPVEFRSRVDRNVR